MLSGPSGKSMGADRPDLPGSGGSRRRMAAHRAAGTRALVADMLEERRPVRFGLWRIVNMGIWGESFSVSL
jgi:hypothetical protein